MAEGRLVVVYSAHDLRGDGEGGGEHTGVAGNAPEARKRLVQAALRAKLPRDAFREVRAPEATLGRLASRVHDPDMVDFLETAWQRWEEEWARASASREHLVGVFALVEEDNKKTTTTTPPLIAGFAAPRHDWGQRAPPSSVFSQACYFLSDKETPIHASTRDTLAWDLAVVRESVDVVLRREARVVYAQITHPGHHASRSNASGFCFLNQAAVAVRLLQAQLPRVAVVDVDYHAGNGTASIFWTDASVFVASLHADPHDDYPFNSGFADQTGPPPPHPAHGTTMNVPLPGGTTWSSYREHLRTVVARVRAFKPDALVVSLGVDTLRGDPVAWPLSRFDLVPADYAEMGAMLLRELGLPTVVVQEGGYLLSSVPDAITSFLVGGSAGALATATKL